jgi:hypothetical protein
MKTKLLLLAVGIVRRQGWLLLLAICTGCSSKGTVSGKVTYQGKPVPAGTIIFVPQAGGGFSANIRDGEYKIEHLPEGPVKIAVSTPANTAPMKGLIGKMQLPPEMLQKLPPEMLQKLRPGKSVEETSPDTPTVSIPPRFQDPEKSGLTYTVKGGSQVFDINLPDK